MALSDDDLKKMAQLINGALDTRGIATKDDLKQLAEDLGDRYLKVFETKTDHQQSYDELKNLIKNLPTKEEFFSRMDKLSGEYKKNDQEHTIQAGQLSSQSDKLEDHEKRITTLEQNSLPSAN